MIYYVSFYAPWQVHEEQGRLIKNLKILKIPFDKTDFYDILSFYIRNSAGNDTVTKVDKKLKIFQICA